MGEDIRVSFTDSDALTALRDHPADIEGTRP